MMIELQSTEDGCGHMDVLRDEELECKICYCTYTLCGRRPKLLECCHHLCAKCLAKMLDLGESPSNTVVCPFCRYITRLPREAVSGLPDDCNLVAALALHTQNQRNFHFHQEVNTELLLSPQHLSSLMGNNPPAMSASSSSSSTNTYSSIRGSPNFVVITIMEPPPVPSSHHNLQCQSRGSHVTNRGYHSSSLDSMASITQRWTVWNCAALLCQTSARVLVWALGLLYFSSLPMGVYLLIMQRMMLGVLLVSLVPTSLIMIMVYGFCQCICNEFRDCIPQ